MSELAPEMSLGIPTSLTERIGLLDPDFVVLDEVSKDLESTRCRLNELEHKKWTTQDSIRHALGAIAAETWDSSELSDLKKLSICAGLDGAGLYANVRRLYDASLESLIDVAQKETVSIETSLAAVIEVANIPQQPVFYCQITGGESYIGWDGPQERPTRQYQFTAKTKGSGAVVERSLKYIGQGSVGFKVVKPSADDIGNFISGSYVKNQGRVPNDISVGRVEQLVGTEERAEIILERSLRSLQSNPVFVGEAACTYAKNFLKSVPKNPR